MRETKKCLQRTVCHTEPSTEKTFMKKTTEWEREGEGKCVIKEDFCVCTHTHTNTHTHGQTHSF